MPKYPNIWLPAYASVDEVLEEKKEVLGDPTRKKTSDLKLENAVLTGKYFGPTYLCHH